MKRRSSASSHSSSSVRSGCALLVFLSATGVAILLPGTLPAQTLSGATVQLGQTSLALPAGGSIYIYGMGTGGAMPATNFAQGPYAQVVDAGGQTVAGLAMTQSNNNTFTTDCADYTIAGISVTGFKTVSASYGSNNQPHPTSASASFLVSDPAVVVIFAIAGGEDHLEVQGLPGLQIDAQKGPDQSHGIAIAIGHASLAPGKYVVTETTEGDPGRFPEHEGDLIGVFVFTGGSGIVSEPHSNVSPPSSPPTSPLPLPGQGNPSPPTPLPPAPIYVFNGAYAAYNIRSGSVSAPFSVSISEVDPTNQTYKISSTGQGTFPSSRTARFNEEGFTALSPNELTMVRSGVVPPGVFGEGAKIRHDVTTSVPAGTFSTEEVSTKEGTLWIDTSSGVWVKGVSPELAKAFMRQSSGVDAANATIELTATNVPMSSATSPVFVYGLIAGMIVLALGAGGFVVARRRKSLSLRFSSASGSGTSLLPVPAPQPQIAGFQRESPRRAAPITGEALDRIAKLKSLLDAKLITQEDFDREKAKLLAG